MARAGSPGVAQTASSCVAGYGVDRPRPDSVQLPDLLHADFQPAGLPRELRPRPDLRARHGRMESTAARCRCGFGPGDRNQRRLPMDEKAPTIFGTRRPHRATDRTGAPDRWPDLGAVLPAPAL